jgi:hypothetical protein
MKLTVIINESQKKVLITESISDELIGVLKTNYETVKNIIEETSKEFGGHFNILISWGATIGGLIEPLSRFMRGNYSGLSDVELSLILLGVILIYFQDNKSKVKEVINVIKEKGLEEPFKIALYKSQEFKTAFMDFMGSLNLHLHKVTNLMSYAFLAPILFYLAQYATSGEIDNSTVKEISDRLLTSGLLTVSSIGLRNSISKIIKRFSS